MITTREYLVFDVESIGLHGEGYAVAGGIYGPNGSRRNEFCFACNPNEAQGMGDDRKWVKENIPVIAVTHDDPRGVRAAFWELWMAHKKDGVWMAADCAWPVEARFLHECVRDSGGQWDGPYPLVDIGSVLLGAGGDPLMNYPRLPDELPKHDPLADARQSARILWDTLPSL